VWQSKQQLTWLVGAVQKVCGRASSSSPGSSAQCKRCVAEQAAAHLTRRRRRHGESAKTTDGCWTWTSGVAWPAAARPRHSSSCRTRLSSPGLEAPVGSHVRRQSHAHKCIHAHKQTHAHNPVQAVMCTGSHAGSCMLTNLFVHAGRHTHTITFMRAGRHTDAAPVIWQPHHAPRT